MEAASRPAARGAAAYAAAMATTLRAPVPTEVLDPVERLLFEAIGLTSVALGAAAATDLTLPQWRALVVVGRSDGIRVGELGGRVGMSLPSASRLVRRLERQGYVTTARDQRDGRATQVWLTDTGRAVREAVIVRRRELVELALAPHGSRLPGDLAAGLAVIAEALAPYE
jgi:DNA-binding MarR family transcriptional regulator